MSLSTPGQGKARRVVLKFGGTSVGELERISRVARFVRNELERGYGVAVIVSAMSGETNRLVGLVEGAGPPAAGPPVAGPAAGPGSKGSESKEYDTVVSSGEQVTSGLLALTLQRMGFQARSWQGWQIPLHTDEAHGKARISHIPEAPLGPAIDSGEVAVISGFQGISPDGRITTLGRGGSDTTAVAIASALRAEYCDIYTDVDGVYTTDPRITRQAKRLSEISYEEMLEMASLGAKVLQTRSVEVAMAHHVPLRVLSSFEDPDALRCVRTKTGTVIRDEEEIMEKQVVAGVTPSKSEAKISLLTVPDHPGRASRIFTSLGEAGVNVDMIVQSPAKADNAANISFTLSEDDMARAESVLVALQHEIGYSDIIADRHVSKVSVIGVGMRSHTGVAATMFSTLADKGINILNIATSEIKISVLIEADYTELAVRALHTAYGLDAKDAETAPPRPIPEETRK